MSLLRRGSIVIARLVLLIGLLAIATACTGKAGPAGTAGPKGDAGQVGPVGPRGPAAQLTFYNVNSAETTIPNTPPGTGNLTLDVLCKPGDIATGGGVIIHPSGTTDLFVTKNYGTDAAGAVPSQVLIQPILADRWRGKVVNPRDIADKRFSVHVICVDVTP